MPTYEYKCEKCGRKFEIFQSIKDDPLKTCPKCKGKVKRLISTGAGFIFKGSGFYTTDYRSEGYKKKQKEEQPSSSKGIADADKTPKETKTSQPKPEPKKTPPDKK
jgi:putative FmdB family regulatory protein